MTLEEILVGEPKNVQFKENLPNKDIKYMKYMVTFANGIGGRFF
jgi:predicted HTH transcriptional regulator